QPPLSALSIPDQILFRGSHVGSKPHIVEHLTREAGRKRETLDGERDHSGNVRVGLFDRRIFFETRNRLETEIADKYFGPIEPERKNDRGCRREESKSLRQYANNLARLSFDREHTSEHAWIAAKLALPVRIAEHDAVRSGCCVLVRRERPPERHPDTKDRQRGLTHEQRRH